MSETIAPSSIPDSARPKPRAAATEQRPGKAGFARPAAEAARRLHPAICYVGAAAVARAMRQGDDFHRAAGLGFNTVLLAAPFAGNEVLAEFDRLSDAQGGGEALPALSAAAHAAAMGGLRLMLDLDLAQLVQRDVDDADTLLRRLQEAGIGGFRCLNATRVAKAAWRGLLAAAHGRDPEARFIAWTAGSPAAAVVGLRDAGFDYGFSSSCWWDFKSSWLNEDAWRIGRIGPAIAAASPPDEPFTPNEVARRRALHFAAFYGAGWLMPLGFELGCWEDGTPFDLAAEVRQLNELRNRNEILSTSAEGEVVSSAGSEIALLRRGQRGGTCVVIAANSSVDHIARLDAKVLATSLACGEIRLLHLDGSCGRAITQELLQFLPGEVTMLQTAEPVPILIHHALAVDPDAPRIAIEALAPIVDDGGFPVRRVLGETVEVTADLIADGHDKLAAEVLWRAADEREFSCAPMILVNNDRWQGEFPLTRLGRHVYKVAAWKDVYGSFVDELTKKHAAGVPTRLEIEEGLALIDATAKAPGCRLAGSLQALLRQLEPAPEETRRAVLLSEETIALMRAADRRKFLVYSDEVIVDAERQAAAFASWYEIFPRSQSGDPACHGNFRDVIRQLPRIAEMGFDVLYFPPIHPIGRINRKGRNNTLTPGPDDPGSPYAIGAEEGGHDALHPQLGTFEDFAALREAAAAQGLELAIDFAIQCAPDHPWLQQHPEWFDWRPDGSLRYAENPPKKYEDIVNVDFYAEGALPSLWYALRDVVQFWVNQGIRLFRVDNPHTKPLPFWAWLIADIRGRHPDAVFLAEAFTRPKLMYRLAKIGFSQSYTYFTWRNTKQELTEYLTELTTTPVKEFFRPHFFVNTPDINPMFLQHSGRPGFLIRAALAATLSGLWGVYNGFELCESAAIPGKEEYLHSEKYEIKAWDHGRPGNIVAEISRLNRIRRGNSALHTHLGVEFLNAFNDQILYFFKRGADGNAILAAISLDPFNAQQAEIEIPLWRFGLADHGVLAAEDLMRDHSFVWHGKRQTVFLNPAEIPFCIWRVQKLT